MGNNNQPPAAPVAQHLTPQQQLWNETTPEQQSQLSPLLRCLKKPLQQDLCLGLVAAIRFSIRRPFANPLLQFVFVQCLTIVGRLEDRLNEHWEKEYYKNR